MIVAFFNTVSPTRTRSRPRRISPRKKQKSLERLMALKIQHCAQRWMLRRQPRSNSTAVADSSTEDTGIAQRSQSPTSPTPAAAPIAALAPPSSSPTSLSPGTVVPEHTTSQGYCPSSHSSTVVLAPPPSPLPPPAGRSLQPSRAAQVARNPRPSRVDQAASDTLSLRPPRRAATRSKQKSSGETHLPKSRSGL